MFRGGRELSAAQLSYLSAAMGASSTPPRSRR